MIVVSICKIKPKLLLLADDNIKFKNIMKKHYSILMIILCAAFTVKNLSAQGNDDLYFDGVETAKKKEIVVERPEINDEISEEEDYVDENYEYEYSARIRRFHEPARGFSYYSNYYTDNYWYDPFMPGMNIYVIQPFYTQYSWGWGYPYSNWGYNSWGYGWSSFGGYYGYNNFANNPWANNWGSPWGYNSYWSGYNNGYWNGWYNNGWHNNGWRQQNNWNGWFESAAPNAGNFVTNRYARGSDAGVHRSRNTPVEGYDNQQRQIQNAPDRLNPDKVGRQRENNTNPNIRPNINEPQPNVRPDRVNPQPNVRPDRVNPQPNVRPQTNPNVHPPVRIDKPTREPNPTRTLPERRDNGGFNNNSFNNNSNGGFNGSGRSMPSPSAPSPAIRSSGGRR
jgi:hypothetical protein